jgi:Crp-like helix-turn-helix domain
VEEHSALEVGMVGNEGMVGISVFLGVPDALNRALVQGAGMAMRMTTQAFRKHVGSSGNLPDALRLYTYQLLRQVSQTAVCNRFHKTNTRLARWLLMTRDRLASNEFELTQQFLADMLGVRREGVTAAARELQQAELIRYVRGQITILNSSSLETMACHCYAVIKLAPANKPTRKHL